MYKRQAYIQAESAGSGSADSFTLNRSATVMLLSPQPLSLPEGWTEDASLTAQRYQKVDPSTPGYGAYEELSYGYSKEYSVTDSPVTAVSYTHLKGGGVLPCASHPLDIDTVDIPDGNVGFRIFR